MRFDSFETPWPKRMNFDIHDLPRCIVNAVRRTIPSEVQTAAFRFDPLKPDADDSGVRVVANTSPIHNEMLADRMALLPVCMDANELERFARDTSRYRFSVRVKNKGAAGAANIDVTSRDIRITDAVGVAVEDGVRDSMFPPDPISGDHPLVVCLRPSPTGDGQGEEVAIDCTASCSVGREHPRWVPAWCTFRNVVDEALADSAYSKVSSEKSRAEFDSLDAHRCFRRNEYGDPVAFRFCIESQAGLSPAFVFFKALRILVARVRRMADDVESRDGALVTDPNVDDYYKWAVEGEGHTLGNLVQGMLHELHVWAEGPRDGLRVLRFVGYHVDHPQDASVTFRFVFAPGTDPRAFLVDALRDIATRIEDVARAWAKPSGLDGEGVREVDEFLANITASLEQ